MPSLEQRVALLNSGSPPDCTRPSTTTSAHIVAPDAHRGMAVGGPHDPVVVLTVEDAARIAAMAASDIQG